MANSTTGYTPSKSASVQGKFTVEQPEKKPLNTMALVAFAVTLCCIWIDCAPVALMLGTIASGQIKVTRERGSFFAEFAIIVGTVVTVLMVVLWVREIITGWTG